MGGFRLDRLLEILTSVSLLQALLLLGIVALAVALVVLLWTHWGDSHPLSKCMLLSLLAHVLLAGWAATMEIVVSIPLRRSEDEFHLASVDIIGSPDGTDGGGAETATGDEPWELFPHGGMARADAAVAAREPAEKPADPKRQSASTPAPLPGAPPVGGLALSAAKQPEVKPAGGEERAGPPSGGREPEAIDAPPPQRREAVGTLAPVEQAPAVKASALEPGAMPGRTPSSGFPPSLLDELGSLPRVADITPATGPGDALPGPDEDLAHPTRSPLEEPFVSAAGTGTSGHGVAYISGGPQTGRLHAPDVPTLAGRTAGSGDGASPGNGAGGVGLGTGASGGLLGPPRLPSVGRPGGTDQSVPPIYNLRTDPNRAGVAQRHGASPETEAAVKAALKWLAENQSENGRWDSRATGGGKELFVLSKNRQGAGVAADSGMTGLALLAFLASGHTHLKGEYRENVRRGLEYLLRIQGNDGNLAGPANSFFTRMYCHAMATFAMSEAYGMTKDQRLEQPVRRAIAYTVAAQNPTTGGWRYVPGDPGDTSQFGWQWMALKSADLAGIPIPDKTRQGAIRYLRSVASGRYGGLASYRPTEPASRPMTAEALVCWQFLGMPREHPAGNEAGDYLLGELPSVKGKSNIYYWYYATLSMYQLQGTHWQKWNQSMCQTLVESQHKTGPLAGSWDTDDLWGGYGGRVYTTALAALCLEVYYRFLPLYAEAAASQARAQ